MPARSQTKPLRKSGRSGSYCFCTLLGVSCHAVNKFRLDYQMLSGYFVSVVENKRPPWVFQAWANSHLKAAAPVTTASPYGAEEPQS